MIYKIISDTSGAAPTSKKRPAWDLKGRLQDMEEMFAKNKQIMEGKITTIETLMSQNSQLKGDIECKESERYEVSKERQILEKQLR